MANAGGGNAPVVEDLPRTGSNRSAADVVRLVGALALLAVGYVVTAVYRKGTADVQGGVVDAIAQWPAGLRGSVVGATQLLAVAVPAAVAGALLVRRRFRLLAALVAGAALAVGLTLVVTHLILDSAHPVSWDLSARTRSWLAQTSFPTAAYLAGCTAAVRVADGWLSRRWRRALWAAVLLLAASRVGTSGIVAVDLVFALTAGVAAGAAVLVAIGGPDKGPRGAEVAAALAAAGERVASLRQIAGRKRSRIEYRAELADGRSLHVVAHDRDDRDQDIALRLFDVVFLRGFGSERKVFTSLRQDVEHEAFVSMWAARVGAPVPALVALRSLPSGSIVEATEWIDGGPLDSSGHGAISDAVLRSWWEGIAVLHEHRIAHGALRAANALVAPDEGVWLVGFDAGEVDAPDVLLAEDIAEALVSSAVVTSAERAVATAASVLGTETVSTALPLLQPLALSVETQRELRSRRSLLPALRSQLSEVTGTGPVELMQLERVRPRTVAAVLAAFVAMWVLLPKLANAGDALAALRHAQPGYVLGMLPLTLALYVFSTIQLMGACAERLPFGPTYRCQMAAAFMNRVTPNNVGGMAVNARYLQRAGVEPGIAAAAVGVSTVADQILTVGLVVLFVVWAGRGTSGVGFSLADASTVLIVVAVAFALLGLGMLTPRGRALFRAKVLPFLHGVRQGLADVAQSPTRLLLIFGGSLGHTATDFAALVLALGAFGPLPPIGAIGAVYFGASALASASPTPGGLGAVEAAMIAGLTGIGVGIVVATPAVLVYRLITYWAVMLPGWISLRVMKSRGEV